MSSIFIIIAGILWGIISVFVTSLKSIGFSSMEVVALRVIFSAIILLIYLLVTDRSKLKIKLKDIPLFCGTGICSIVFFLLFSVNRNYWWCSNSGIVALYCSYICYVYVTVFI